MKQTQQLAAASIATVAVLLPFALPRGLIKRFIHRHIYKPKHYDSQLTLDEFIESEAHLAWTNLLRNIHPLGTAPGCVVASPSKYKPDYWYQWTRDSALVLREVLRKYQQGDESVLSILLDFVDATRDMQHRQTLCGGFTDGGLGEVKFYVDREPFQGPWGRPQRDGPALRATLLVAFARHYLAKSATADSYVAKSLYDNQEASETAIRADLDYTVRYWDQSGFDLWEEVDGHHFYTLLCSYRALTDGAAFAKQRQDATRAALYRSTALKIEKRLQDFWDPDKKYIQVTLDAPYIHGKTSGLDTCVILASLHAGEQAGEWTVDNDRILASHFAIVESMRHIYPITDVYKFQYGTGVGRYCEDIYDGVGTSLAHPWYLCTLAHAELLYRLANKIKIQEKVVVSELTKPVYDAILPGCDVTALNASDVSSAIRARADEFVSVVRDWKAPDGSLSEQFSRWDGSPQGATHLTWSYAAFLSMQAARNGAAPF